MASVTIFTGCSEEEVEKPVENTERLDDLRAELRQLELDVLGAQRTLDLAKLDEQELEAEVAKLKENFDKVVKYTVTVIDPQGKLLEGVKVITTQAGTLKEGTTNSEGRVTFDNMRGGVIAAVVKHDNYATANYTASLYSGTDNYQSYGASTRVIMFPLAAALTSDNMTSFNKQKLFYNTSVQDDTLGGTAWDASADPMKWAPKQFTWTGIKYDQVTKGDNIPVVAKLVIDGVPSGSGSGEVGDIIAIAYENAVYTATWNDDNTFTLNVPARSIYDDWFDYEVSFGAFTKTVTLNVNNASPTAKSSNYPKTYTEERVFRIGIENLWGDIPGTVYDNEENWFYSTSKF
jgi:hypothetical protein